MKGKLDGRAVSAVRETRIICRGRYQILSHKEWLKGESDPELTRFVQDEGQTIGAVEL